MNQMLRSQFSLSFYTLKLFYVDGRIYSTFSNEFFVAFFSLKTSGENHNFHSSVSWSSSIPFHNTDHKSFQVLLLIGDKRFQLIFSFSLNRVDLEAPSIGLTYISYARHSLLSSYTEPFFFHWVSNTLVQATSLSLDKRNLLKLTINAFRLYHETSHRLNICQYSLSLTLGSIFILIWANNIIIHHQRT